MPPPKKRAKTTVEPTPPAVVARSQDEDDEAVASSIADGITTAISSCDNSSLSQLLVRWKRSFKNSTEPLKYDVMVISTVLIKSFKDKILYNHKDLMLFEAATLYGQLKSEDRSIVSKSSNALYKLFQCFEEQGNTRVKPQALFHNEYFVMRNVLIDNLIIRYMLLGNTRKMRRILLAGTSLYCGYEMPEGISRLFAEHSSFSIPKEFFKYHHHQRQKRVVIENLHRWDYSFFHEFVMSHTQFWDSKESALAVVIRNIIDVCITDSCTIFSDRGVGRDVVVGYIVRYIQENLTIWNPNFILDNIDDGCTKKMQFVIDIFAELVASMKKDDIVQYVVSSLRDFVLERLPHSKHSLLVTISHLFEHVSITEAFQSNKATFYAAITPVDYYIILSCELGDSDMLEHFTFLFSQRQYTSDVEARIAAFFSVYQQLPTAKKDICDHMRDEFSFLDDELHVVKTGVFHTNFDLSDVCVICREPLSDGKLTFILDCGLPLHTTCFQQLVKVHGKSVKCPICMNMLYAESPDEEQPGEETTNSA